MPVKVGINGFGRIGRNIYRAAHGRQGLPDFMRDGGGQASERGHAVFGGHLLLQPVQFGEVLEVEDKPAAFFGSQA